MDELDLVRLDASALDEVCVIHAAAFPDSGLTVFGSEAVRRYYRWLLEGPHDALLMGVRDGDRLLGFCAAGVFRGAMSGFLRANRAYLALTILRHPRLLASPLIQDRAREAVKVTLRFSRVFRAVKRGPAPQPQFGVLAIATDPTQTGRGVARALIAEAEQRARRLGHTRMVLTVHPENVRAIRVYEGMGWNRTMTSAPWAGAMHRDLV